jgi:hypothetical protein
MLYHATDCRAHCCKLLICTAASAKVSRRASGTSAPALAARIGTSGSEHKRAERGTIAFVVTSF